MRYVFVLFLCVSCKAVIKKIYGVKKPALESAESLNPFLNEVGVSDTTYSYYCKDTTSLYKVLKFSKGLPEIFAFATDGSSVSYKANEKQCNGMVSEFIAKKENFRVGFSDSSHVSWNQLQKLIVPVHASSRVLSFDKGVVYIIWSKWIGGKLNREKTATWVNEMKKSVSDVKVAFLNVDFIRQWGMTERDMPEINF